MQTRGVNQVTLSARSGIAASRINNYLQGKYRTIRRAHLAAIVTALAPGPADIGALVEAYLFDLLPESCRGLIEIQTPDARESGRWTVPTKGLPADFADAFRDLYRLCVNEPKVRERTMEWVGMMRETVGDFLAVFPPAPAKTERPAQAGGRSRGNPRAGNGIGLIETAPLIRLQSIAAAREDALVPSLI